MRCLTLNECQQWRKKHCRRDEWKRQTTCVTPLKRLPWYTAVLVGQLQPFARALLIIDQVVFRVPPELESFGASRASARHPFQCLDTPFEMTVMGFDAHRSGAVRMDRLARVILALQARVAGRP